MKNIIEIIKNKRKRKIPSSVNWYSGRSYILSVQRNVLLLLLIFFTCIATFSVILLNSVYSFQSLEPYVIELEEKTGIATVIKSQTNETFTENEALKKYFINKFLSASTEYSPLTYKKDAELVRLMSNKSVYNDFRNRINPLRLGSNGKIKIKIKTIRYFGKNRSEIRILRTINSKILGSKTTDEIINLTFEFNKDIKLTNEERLENPLGFQVLSYFISEEY